jgi:glycogen debranching enzyme
MSSTKKNHSARDPVQANGSNRRAARRKIAGIDPFYIQATAPLADEQNRVLKCGETFGVFDHFGDIKPVGLGEEGLYHEGTRFLSCLALQLNQDRPLILSSTVKDDNELLTVDLTNPDVYVDGQLVIARGTLHVARTKFLCQGGCYESLALRNYGLTPLTALFSIHFEADFADIFEVRGTKRKGKGTFLDDRVEGGTVWLSYEGLDGLARRTRLEFSPEPAELDGGCAVFHVTLPPKAETRIYLSIACELGPASPRILSYRDALAMIEGTLRQAKAEDCEIVTSNEEFNAWLTRSLTDLHMMTTEMPNGPYPFAGVPWFSTVFGRDGIITALEMLWFKPRLARGVLAYLAATQAQEVQPDRDAEPGKIIHEVRKGEMAALGEVPFGRYYGSVDATPLFLMLAGAYYERTADQAFLETIWPNLELALQWIDTHGDKDGDGFVEYARQSAKGLIHQGWKDSHDAIFHADGTQAEGPISLCEVQGYVYAAKRNASLLAAAMGDTQRADDLARQAHALQERFEQAFWCEDIGSYALALDGKKKPCRIRSSNVGHCLMTGIASRSRGALAGQAFLQKESFSGWGIRTIASGEVRYNPMSYHNGSVWPHDNAMIAAGLVRYGLKAAALEVMAGLFEASRFLDLHRMPELFCGFERRPGEGPTLYPVACAPQSWSAAAVFLLLQACLGLRLSGPEGQISFHQPMLPEFLKEVRIKNLQVGEASVDLLLQRHAHHVGLNVLAKRGHVEILVSV